MLLVFGWSLLHADPPTPERIEELVKQLGSSKFAERDKAKRELESIGAPALPALRQGAKSEDAEVSRRAGELLRTLQDKLTTAAYLSPKKVRLNVKDTSVLEAVEQLSKTSGYPLKSKAIAPSLRSARSRWIRAKFRSGRLSINSAPKAT